jgi:parallel beta-helix repeat protein
MKNILLALLLITGSMASHANYSTPGTGKTWNLDSLVANSGGDVSFSSGSYFVNDTIVVSLSDTVRVKTDFVMKLSSQVFIDIFGVLIVDPPTTGIITAIDTSQKFLGLKFEDQSDGSMMRKTIFEYGNGIRMLDCNVLMDSCIIRYNTLNSTFSSYAVSLFRSNSIISNNKIYRNRRSAIGSGANIASSPRIINNIIYENDTENANVPQINLGASASDTLLIRGNTISGLFDNCGGISLLPVGSIPIALIEDNTIRKNRYGIAVAGGNSNIIIRGNRIDSNNIQGVPTLGGSGINFNGSSSQICIVSNNIIRGNLWGITIQGTAKPNMGNLSNTSNLDDGRNAIYGNTNSGKIFDLFNNTPDSIKAENNWWGSSNTDSVEAHIFHKPDSSALGFVDYLPLGKSTRTGNSIELIIPTSIKVTAYPNPFNPVTTIEYKLPESGLTEILLYDVSGKVVRTIMNARRERGENKEILYGQGLSSGTYFVRIRSGIYSAVGKLVLLK